MTIKMIAVDLDDTLLREDKTVSARSWSALRQCREQGIRIVCATGRGSSADILAPDENFDGKVLCNGTQVYSAGELVKSHTISSHIIRPFILACEERGFTVRSLYEGMAYTNFDVSKFDPGATQYRVVDFSKHNLDTETLMMIRLSDDDVRFIRSILPDGCRAVFSRRKEATIMKEVATKSNGMAQLAQLWGISQSQIVAFGDDENDIDMLSYAGIGVAMGNAVCNVKKIADCVTLSNEEDGVAVWIEQNILNRERKWRP